MSRLISPMKRGVLGLLLVTLSTGLVGFIESPAHASGRTTVNIQGVVSADGESLQVGAHVSGGPSSLSGTGFDVPRGVGMCLIGLTGSISGGVVSLEGPVTFSNDPNQALGVIVTYEVNVSTGHLTWVFDATGPAFTFEGTVKVVISNS